jgi:hypothetical protein
MYLKDLLIALEAIFMSSTHEILVITNFKITLSQYFKITLSQYISDANSIDKNLPLTYPIITNKYEKTVSCQFKATIRLFELI